MKKDRKTSADAGELRRRAEARLRAASTKGAFARTETDLQRLVHELQVHQVELEMQNDELHQSRAEVEAGLERYTDLYDFAPVGFLTLSRDGVIRQVNLTGAHLLGMERALLQGQRIRVFVDKPDRSVFSAFLEKVFASQAKEVCEVALLKEGKGLLTVHITATVSQDGQECRAMMSDITKQKQAEAETKHLASFPMLNPRPIVEVDVAGHVHFFNPVAEQMFPDLYQRGVGHPWLADWKSVMRSLREGGSKPIVREVHFDEKWYHQTMHLVEDGQRVRIYGADITVRKQTEEALRQSREDLDRAQAVGQIGWWRLDTRKNVLTWSPENHRIFGVPKGTPLTYEAFLATAHPDDRQYVDSQWQACLRGEPYDMEHRIVAHGQVKWVREKAYLEFDGEGQLLGGFGITQDITARKQAEEGLQQLNLSLEQLVSERTSELSHTVDVLQEEIEKRARAEEELKLANELLAQRADQLRRLAGELTMTEQAERKRISKILHDGLQQHLASAKLQLGGLAEQIENVDLKRTADEIVSIISEGISMSRSLSAELSPPILHEGGLSEALEWLTRWMREKHRFSVDLSLGVVPELREDVKMLVFESVRELLFNALKHAQASRAQVHLELVGDGEMRVTVSDEGVGFDPCRLLPAGDGGGFGLFSIRERIGLLGGRLEIDSAPGRGSRVMLTVSHHQADATQFLMNDVCAPVILLPKGAAEDQETTIRVLLVDDHALFRNGIGRLLKNEPGLEVVGEAKDGQEAIEFTQKHNPNVILMDISMPGINGIEATRVIHERRPGVCIIGLSMYDDPEKERAMLAAGATKYMTKGCAGAELVAAIRAGLQTRKPSSK